MSAPQSRFVRACKAQPVDSTPVWFMRQAGRYMSEYRAIRKSHSLIEICKKPALAAEVTITAAEALGVDAAIIFAHLLLPLEVMRKLVAVVSEYAVEQVRAGGDAIQVFDSWVGCLSVEDYRRYVLPHVTELVKKLQKTGAPVIYFGTETTALLPSMKETEAEVIGLDWRIPLDDGWRSMGFKGAVQGNLDPVLLFSDWKELKSRAEAILRRSGGRPGHIFNLGHGILPETPVENVKALAQFVREHSAKTAATSG